MRVAVVPGPGRSGLLCVLREDGSRDGEPVAVPDLTDAIAAREADVTRWVWPSGASVYPRLLEAGVRVARCHDVLAADRLLTTRDEALGGSVAGGFGPAVGRSSAGDGGFGPGVGGSGAGDGGFGPGVGGSGAGDGEFGPGVGRSGAGDGGPGLARPEYRAAVDLLAAAEPVPAGPGRADQYVLFDAAQAGAVRPSDPGERLDAVITAHAAQLRGIAADQHPARFALLVTAESAGALAAAEMTAAGLPWRADVHDALLAEQLGPRPAVPGMRPARLAELAAQVAAAFGGRRPVNPDSPSQLLQALAADGIRVSSTRLAILRDVDHPAIAPLLEYKELSRLHSAFGWSWLDTWVHQGRFRPEYVVGGVVSGRWASRGGGALQIPRMLRRAVVADPGRVLVVADAAQLEPRVLAALAGDRAFAAAAAAGDLYTELAGAFGGDRAKAKVAMLSAMYGGAGGEAGQLLAVLRQRFPAAAGYVEAAARAGEEGRTVRSVLGRTCPPPSANWRALTEEAADPEAGRDPRSGAASRARGRFTRNFVVQASAADWALVLVVCLRAALAALAADAADGADGADGSGPDRRPELVFFQHDEVIVDCTPEQADAVVAATAQAAAEASRLVFGPTRVAFPLSTAVVDCYADAK